MYKRILSILLLAVMCFTVTACGGEASNSESQNADSSATDTASTDTPKKEVDAVLTVTAQKGEISKFKSDRPYDSSKEDISLILVVGQSNFTTSVGFSCEYKYLLDGKTEVVPEEPLMPEPGTVYSSSYCSAITELTSARDVSRLCDPANGTSTMGGVTPSFGRKWYEITGKKVVFVQCAVGAVGVHEWTPEPELYTCTCNKNGQGVLYKNTISAYQESFSALSKKYNIVYTGYIWNQGEHDEVYGKEASNTVNCDVAYYTAYKSMHDGFMNDLKLDFGGISVVRSDGNGSTAQGSMHLTIARAAQYKLCDDIDNLYMISTIGETCDHSMMDQSNTIHYAQKTFNKMGTECAENLARYLGITSASAFDGIKVYSESGTLLTQFDAEGNLPALTDDAGFVAKGHLNNQILAKVSTLGNGYTIKGYTLTLNGVDDTGSTEYIDQFGKIDWATVNGIKSVKTVEVKCVIE